jgi:hypothetical protein
MAHPSSTTNPEPPVCTTTRHVPRVLNDVTNEIKAYTELLGPRHLLVGDLYNVLGLIQLHMQNDTTAATECQQRAMAIYRVNNRMTPPLQMAVCLSDLATCYERQHNVNAALAMYQEAREIILTKVEIVEENSFHRQSIERSLARLLRR